jgi:hypothetical protein
MKKFIWVLFVTTIALIAWIVYERYLVQSEFGPSSMLAVFLLVCFALALIITLLSYGTRFYEYITRIWLLVISTGMTFIIADLVAGALLIKTLSPELSPDKFRHHKLVPNTYSRFEQKDFSYIQRVNNIGLRGKDRTLEKPLNHYRILMLGDSFTMGKGVEDDQTFSFLIEESLNKNNICQTTTFEVLNGGVDSYAPILSYLQLSRDLVHLDPDVIVLNLDVSDLVQEAAYRENAIYNSNGEIVGVPGTERPVLLNQRIRRWIDQNMYFTRLILFYTNKLLGYKDLSIQGVVTRANNEIIKYTLSEDKTNRNKQWKQMFDSISMIKKFSDDRSISFILVIYPWGHQVNDSEWIPGRYNFMSKDATASDKYLETIYQLSEKFGITLVNLFPLFRTYKSNSQLYFDYDMHWTVEGHKVIAKGLERFFRDNFSTQWCK